MTTLQLSNSINRSPCRRASLLITLVLGYFTLSPMAHAKPHPTPTATPAPTPSPTPLGEDRGNGNTAAENVQAFNSNTTGTNNTATGWQSLFSNTAGNDNTTDGFQALFSNTIGDYNTANGYQVLFSNSTGNSNTANGVWALYNNTTGNYNTANGYDALGHNVTGNSNTASGVGALVSNTTGNFNTALGIGAGFNVTTANNVIAIGSLGANVSYSCFIGRVRGVTTAHADAIPVLIDSNDQLGTASSSRRFKKEIKPMGQVSEAILALKPVTFHYKSDPAGAGPQFGLIAEEVAEVNPDLVVRDENGEIYTVRYEAVNAMLLNEFLKEHRAFLKEQQKVDEQEATIAQLKNGIERLATHLKVQDSKIEKVSAQLAAASPSRGGLETRNPAPQIVLNNQ